jgi:hypothetical protein
MIKIRKLRSPRDNRKSGMLLGKGNDPQFHA